MRAALGSVPLMEAHETAVRTALGEAARSVAHLIGFEGETRVAVVPVSDIAAGHDDPAWWWTRSTPVTTGCGDQAVAVGADVDHLGQVPSMAPGEAASLVHVALSRLVVIGAAALQNPEAIAALNTSAFDPEEVARVAARGLLARAASSAGLPADQLFTALNRVSALPLEGGPARGNLVLATGDGDGVEVQVRLASPVPLSDARTLRKLLEVSGAQSLALLTDGRDVFGLGAEPGAAEAVERQLTRIDIVGTGCWEVRHQHRRILRVEFGVPMLPRLRLDRATFSTTARQVLGDAVEGHVDYLWSVVEALARQVGHGTTLVVTTAAGQESARLASESLGIDPVRLDPAALVQLARIDGAVVLDAEGRCHSFGAILDGRATTGGDRSRGARFNSAVRYQASAEVATMIVLLSEDRLVDLIPKVTPAVAPDRVADAFRRIRAAAEPPIDLAVFERAWDQLQAIESALSADQRARANELRSHVEAAVMAHPVFHDTDPRTIDREFFDS